MVSLKILPIVFALAAVILVSGCAQQTKKTGQSPAAPLGTSAADQSLAPTQVGSAGDVIGYELVKSDSIESSISDPGLSQLNSDLAAVESGL